MLVNIFTFTIENIKMILKYYLKLVMNISQNKIVKIYKSGKPCFGKIKIRKEEMQVTYPNIENSKKLLKWKELGDSILQFNGVESGFEFETHPGLNFIPGSEVIELPTQVPKPHVGWDSIEIYQDHLILQNIDDGADFYFVHSYHISKIDNSMLIANCDYGLRFPAILAKDNLIGVQFHPEKSQNNGDKLLTNFIELIR